jgi:hypothetical protein
MFESVPFHVKVLAAFLTIVNMAVLNSAVSVPNKLIVFVFSFALLFLSFVANSLIEELKQRHV